MKPRLIVVIAAALLARAEVTYKIQLYGKVIELPAERYVAGVLVGESSVFQSDEAVKAMAVAARTYAARMRGRHASEGFDFCSTTHCQRLDLAAIGERVTNAANATQGELLWFEGRPAFSVYSRDCGGHTEDVRAVWADVEAPYLRAQNDPYCKRAPWSWIVRPQDLVRALRASKLNVPDDLVSITILERTSSGRAKTLALVGKGRTVPIAAGSFRFAVGRELGWNKLRSEQYEIRQLVFRGTGQGHGVGLCQQGADAMGTRGKSYREILASYYPGTQVSRTATGLKWLRLGGEGVNVWTVRPERDRKILAQAERLRRSVAAQLSWPPRSGWEIYVYPDVDTFRNATGEPGWVAAHSSGLRIDMQPQASLRHEMLHGMVENRAARGLPLWFREGVVAWLDRPGEIRAGESRDEIGIEQRQDRERAQRAYGAAKARVARLVAHYGEAAVLTWLERGLPDEVKNSSASTAATNSK